MPRSAEGRPLSESKDFSNASSNRVPCAEQSARASWPNGWLFGSMLSHSLRPVRPKSANAIAGSRKLNQSTTTSARGRQSLVPEPGFASSGAAEGGFFSHTPSTCLPSVSNAMWPLSSLRALETIFRTP